MGDDIKVTKDKLIETSRFLEDLLDRAGQETGGDAGKAVDQWKEVCVNCRRRLGDDLLRMAVVGTIKSGKSTFINSLLSGDYLKRGAGVITSIVTRVRRADRLEAVLYFKSINEINQEIQRSLDIFASLSWRSSTEPFDLRKESDRNDLRDALDSLESGDLLSRDTRSTSSVLLSSYLGGYDKAASIVSDTTETLVYEGSDFFRHQEFAGNQELAVYLKDLELFIDSGDFDENIEIADCQGSDSPNPLHLSMIQDYLYSSDLIVYLISSRTGIRQADIKFMSMIKQMGAMGNVLFVINTDFNEHENLTDLQRVAHGIRKDLELIAPSPELYSFSGLYSLFSAMSEHLPEKEKARLRLWRQYEDLSDFSEKERIRFDSDLRYLITEHRYRLLLKNQLHRLSAAADDFYQWLVFNRRILSADASSAADIVKQTRQQQKKAGKIISIIASTLDGACQQLRKEMKARADNFFDIRHGQVVPFVVEFIKSYSISYDTYKTMFEKKGFSETLLAVFKDFREKLDFYMAEQISPKLFGFSDENEKYILEYLESICRPYETMTREALKEFTANGFDDSDVKDQDFALDSVPVSADAVKKSLGIKMPEASATLDYNRGIKTEAFMKLGFFRAIKGVKKLFRRSDSHASADFAALQAGVAKMKKETEKTIVFYFKNFRENIKFQYLFPLIDGAAAEINQYLADRFQAFDTDLGRIREMTNRGQAEKQKSVDAMEEIISRLKKIREDISLMQKGIQAENPAYGRINKGDPTGNP
jgi:GTPase SAR1 family protein